MIIPVVLAAVFLGRAFDVKLMTTTDNYIFDPDSIKENLVTVPVSFTSSHYRLLESSADVNDALDISGELSLKTKLAQTKIRGYGNYIMNKVDREKVLEVLITVKHQTVLETFPTYTKQRDEYKEKPQEVVGSHYIRSIVYGGELLISHKIVAKKSEYMESIKAALSASVGVGGKFDASVKAKLNKLKEELEDKATVNTQAFATAGAISPVQTLDDAYELMQNYPKLVNELNNGNGALLKLELEPIHSINTGYTKFSKRVRENTLADDATNKYDDIRLAEAEFRLWQQTQLWTDEQQKWINEYDHQLKAAKKEMLKAIRELDLSKEIPSDHFQNAFDAYGKDGDNIPNRYTRELNRLRHRVENLPYFWFPYTKAVTHYIHWGSGECTLPSSDPVYVGYAATSPSGYGSGGTFQCLDTTLEQKTQTVSPTTKVSHISGLTYQHPNGSEGTVYCAFCKLENATHVSTIVGRGDCPENLKLEYSGFLATNSKVNSQFMCVDNNPGDLSGKYPVARSDQASEMVPVWMKCSTCEEDDKNRFINCAVCSR